MSKNKKDLSENKIEKVLGSGQEIQIDISPELIQNIPKGPCCGQGICIPHIDPKNIHGLPDSQNKSDKSN